MEDKRKLSIGITAGVLLAAVIIVVGIISLSGDDDGSSPAVSDQQAATGDNPADPEAVAIFSDNCGQCHTLTVAGTTGTTGPNLDEDDYDRERVLEAIQNGGRGSGGMAEDIIVGAEAEQVAELIAGDEPLR